MVCTPESFGPEIAPLTDNLYVRRWSPSVPLDDSFAHMFASAFRRDTFYYFLPRLCHQPELEHIIEEAGLTNASGPAQVAQRDSLIARVNKNWTYAKNLWALKHLVACYDPKVVTWLAYQKNDTKKTPQVNDDCVGFAQWFLPDSLAVRESWCNYLTRKYLEFKLSFLGYWYFGFKEQPIFNNRFHRYHNISHQAEGVAFAHNDDDEYLHELSMKSTEELTGAGLPEIEKVAYPVRDIGYLSWFCVSKKAHGTGIGTKFLSYTIDNIPNQLTEIVSPVDSTSKSYGPQKLCLHATQLGEPFYKKLGFETLVAYNLGNRYTPLKRNALMVKTRDKPLSV
ncbi:hypothetical protein NADFUDRAFT_81202 [Nadsonia fulvescens var. elongata DSM 6958]|uniref:Uncharacterized protein n=1 Tax=Nadsonia fulvescens var. elongata DSM 6958 TaxID=857566 RepID=A0A1E3PRW2_9ASCO|nr:hypothetical protein NADFUDRAFT_81202 [Nadsonia fulvescens var. elongata DSM 6958]